MAACVTGDGSTANVSEADANADELDPIARGAASVRSRACDTCHQSPDPNDGVLSGQTTPRLGTLAYPANLTPDVETGLGAWPDDKIVRAMRLGVDVHDGPLCAQMPRFNRMTDEEAYSVAAYLKSLPAVHRIIPASTCPPLKPRGDASDASAEDG